MSYLPLLLSFILGVITGIIVIAGTIAYLQYSITKRIAIVVTDEDDLMFEGEELILAQHTIEEISKDMFGDEFTIEIISFDELSEDDKMEYLNKCNDTTPKQTKQKINKVEKNVVHANFKKED